MKRHNDIEEHRLIERFKLGDYKAFTLIYDRYAKSLFSYSLQYTKRVEDAEEIVQDVFVRLWRQRERVRQEDTLRSLLFIMAKNMLINAYRIRVNQPSYEDYLNYVDKLTTEDTRNRVDYSDFLKTFHKVLRTLPPTQRKAIMLSRIQQLSIKEIAEHLSLSEQTIKNQLSLGLKRLRTELDKLIWGIILFLN